MKLFKAALFLIAVTAPLSVSAQAPSDKVSPPTPVIITDVSRVHFADEVEALGTLIANESVDLASSVTELVTEILFDDNQRVKKGDILLKMDAAEELAELAEQQSFLDEAQRQVNRLTPLVKKGAASASILDENKREALAAQARVDAIQSRIDQRIISAPYDGVLGLRNISVGALAQPGSMITTIDDDRIMKLDFSVPEIFLSTLKSGVIIEAKTEAYPEQTFKGEISSVDSRIDPVTRSIQARAILDNENGFLKPGLLMQVVLQKDPRQALVIPEETLIAEGPDNFTFVIKDDGEHITSERRKVILGARQLGNVEILSGLTEGDKIIMHGTLRVRAGAPLEIIAVENNDETLGELLKQKTADQEKDVE